MLRVKTLFRDRAISRLVYSQSLGPEVAPGRRRTPAFAAWSWQYSYPAKGGHRETLTALLCFHNLQTKGQRVHKCVVEVQHIKNLERKFSDIAAIFSSFCKFCITSLVASSSLCRHDSPLSTQPRWKSTHLLWGPGRTLAWRNSAGRRA